MSFPLVKKEKGKNNEMTQCILKVISEIVLKRALRPLQVTKLNASKELKKRELFDVSAKKRSSSSIKPHEDVEVMNNEEDCDESQDNIEMPHTISDIEHPTCYNGNHINQ